ncbi:Uncharacterised protein [Serratia fonticola]|uniref:hypothetical protein n=1 Tax=Serratia fonticola TaxID=47917 RepID=UPI00192AD50A|nr:hypothetical protein [Serratia fonticola]MBL5859875.1 hypothetical protein [Serratia fonticola]CAI2036066.1 Uncharacterised protein [Serratia fonticola]
MKQFPLNVLYRLYKAEAGDIIDNNYVRLSGSWTTNDDRNVGENGLLNINPFYQFVFKDLSDGQYYQAGDVGKRATDPKYPGSIFFTEPFTDTREITRSGVTCQYSTIAVNVAEITEVLQP